MPFKEHIQNKGRRISTDNVSLPVYESQLVDVVYGKCRLGYVELGDVL
jgi:hypothetical protein